MPALAQPATATGRALRGVADRVADSGNRRFPANSWWSRTAGPIGGGVGRGRAWAVLFLLPPLQVVRQYVRQRRRGGGSPYHASPPF